MKMNRIVPVVACFFIIFFFVSCEKFTPGSENVRFVVDQLGRKVKVPREIKKIAALRHFGGKIVFALGKQQLLVDTGILGREADALRKVDPFFATLPEAGKSQGINVEEYVALNPDIVFVYASMDVNQIDQFEQSGVPTVAVKGETLEESFNAIRLMADVLECKEKGEQYIKRCRDLLDLVAGRLKGHVKTPVKVMFAGPKNVYTAATGNMLQNEILQLSGAQNVAQNLKGFWTEVSPEQVAQWNPDVIFLGSYLNVYGREKIYENPHFKTISAVKNRKIYPFPSNIGWWDFPAPHCVLGVVWSAKTLYPELFEDIDMTAMADEFYRAQVGYTFEQMGGHLEK